MNNVDDTRTGELSIIVHAVPARGKKKQIDLGDSEPVRNMRDMAVRGLLVQAATPLPSPGGCAEAGGQDFRIIDLGYLQVPLCFVAWRSFWCNTRSSYYDLIERRFCDSSQFLRFPRLLTFSLVVAWGGRP